MSFSIARTCGFGSRSAISRQSAARSLHSLEVIIGYSPNRTHQSTTRTVGLLDFVPRTLSQKRLRTDSDRFSAPLAAKQVTSTIPIVFAGGQQLVHQLNPL